MSKQSNAKPDKSSTPAASAPSVSRTIGPKSVVHKIDNGGSVHPKPIGPKNAPFSTK